VSLFGVSQADISNLKLTNVNITGDWSVESLVAEQDSGSISRVSVTGNVRGNNLVGGLIGELTKGSVIYSYSSASVYGEANVGGLISLILEDNVIENCYAIGSVTADSTVGGFVGASNGIIRNSYSRGLVKGNIDVDLDVGGFIRFSSGIGTIEGCYYDSQTSGQALSEEDKDSPYAEAKTSSQMKAQATYSGWDFTNVWKMSGYPIFK